MRVPGLAHVTLAEVHLGGCLAGMQVRPEGPVLPDQLLLNVALDLAAAEAVLVVPAGMVLRVLDGADGGDGGGEAAGGGGGGGESVAAVLGAMLRAQRGLQPTTLVLPAYSLTRRADDDAPVLQPARSLAYVPYPPAGSSCGARQPSHLYPDSAPLLAAVNALLDEAGAGAGKSKHGGGSGQRAPGVSAWGGQSYPPVHFSAQDFSRSAALALPVLFSRRCAHGRAFVRFVAELSGPGCFGGSALRVLSGAGYSLRWALGRVARAGAEGGKEGEREGKREGRTRSLAVAALVDDRPSAPLLPARSSQPQCGCAFSQDPNAHRALAAGLNRYYHRASLLRGPWVADTGERGAGGASGAEADKREEGGMGGGGQEREQGWGRGGGAACPLRDVWSRKPFGGLFAQEQRELLGDNAGL